MSFSSILYNLLFPAFRTVSAPFRAESPSLDKSVFSSTKTVLFGNFVQYPRKKSRTAPFPAPYGSSGSLQSALATHQGGHLLYALQRERRLTQRL